MSDEESLKSAQYEKVKHIHYLFEMKTQRFLSKTQLNIKSLSF